MKLMGMTDFVLEYKEWRGDILSDACINYANFLKKPLTLDMFIGDKALFEGCADFPRDFYIDLNVYVIEDMVKYDITLTQHAIKKLEL